jgi:hypothetical protein
MDGVYGNTNGGSAGKPCSRDAHTRVRYRPWEANTHRGIQPQRFVETRIKVREAFDVGVTGGTQGHVGVELCLEVALSILALGEVVEGRDERACAQ